jgi:hypothetical protein
VCLAANGEPAALLDAIRARFGLGPVEPSAGALIAQWQDWPPEPRAPKALAWLVPDDFVIALP